MSDPKTTPEPMVEITVDRLFSIVKAIYDDNLEDEIIRRYGKEVFLLTGEQATRWHSFVDVNIASTPPADTGVDTQGYAAHVTKLVGPRLKGVMGAAGGPNTPHCTPRAR
jgi:hypothetical protein